MVGVNVIDAIVIVVAVVVVVVIGTVVNVRLIVVESVVLDNIAFRDDANVVYVDFGGNRYRIHHVGSSVIVNVAVVGIVVVSNSVIVDIVLVVDGVIVDIVVMVDVVVGSVVVVHSRLQGLPQRRCRRRFPIRTRRPTIAAVDN